MDYKIVLATADFSQSIPNHFSSIPTDRSHRNTLTQKYRNAILTINMVYRYFLSRQNHAQPYRRKAYLHQYLRHGLLREEESFDYAFLCIAHLNESKSTILFSKKKYILQRRSGEI
jgi:hypothetical protein